MVFVLGYVSLEDKPQMWVEQKKRKKKKGVTKGR